MERRANVSEKYHWAIEKSPNIAAIEMSPTSKYVVIAAMKKTYSANNKNVVKIMRNCKPGSFFHFAGVEEYVVELTMWSGT